MKHPKKDIEKKVAVVGCKDTTKELILGLKRYGFVIDHCITIDPKKGEEQKVAGYCDLREFLKDEGISFTVAEKYSLKSNNDKKKMLALGIDMLLIAGWQRLIPEWFLESLSVGAFGMHGSSKPLPHGRGRSPLNWSLIQNKNVFYTHLFRYKPGVDDGNIVSVQKFDINEFDSCQTLHFKNILSMIRLCKDNIPSLLDGSANFSPQADEKPSYYPKRSAEDGMIYWDDNTLDVYNLIRAVTKPFPGAFSYLENDKDSKIFIWKAQPFDTKLEYDCKPGTIADVFENGMFVVKTSDNSLLVTESEGVEITKKDIGKVLSSLEIPKKEWKDLPE